MPEDRDQLFEKALARHLRDESAAESLCLDPETLAAYHERMLSPEEVSAAKTHIVSCARCQEVLAQLEATEAINESHDVAEAVPGMLAVRAASASRQAVEKNAPRSSDLVEAASRSKKVLPIPAKRRSVFRWVAPAGAVAAVLLLWIGYRESRMNMAPAQQTQGAENRQQSLPSSSTAKESNEGASSKDSEKQKSDDFSADQPKEGTRNSRSIAPSPSLRDEQDVFAVDGKLQAERKKSSARSEYSARNGAGIGGGVGPSAAAAQAQANNALQRGDQAVIAGAAPVVKPATPRSDLDKAELHKSQPAPNAKSSGSVIAGLPAAPPPPPPAPPAPNRAPGRLRGTVTDPTGAAIAGANVVLKSADGSTVASTATNNNGIYSFNEVDAGNYQLELQRPGFKTDLVTGLNVAVGENVMNAKLELGTATETVQVTAQASEMSVQQTEAVPAKEMSSFGRNYQALVFASSGPPSVTSADGKAIWKFGEAGRIVHSTNAGKDWTSQTSGVTAKLLAASAPSAKVCWIAGATGTLLRTTNGGKRWQQITVPIPGDLGGVHASDDKHASIWDAANRLSFETTDGGKTWKQAANE